MAFPFDNSALDQPDPADLQAAPPPTWGVYDSSNNPIAQWDSFAGMTFKDSSRAVDAPIEAGSFATYNKVDVPFRAVVRLLCGGDDQTRAAFLTAIVAAKYSVNLYSVVTPDATYLDTTIEDFDYRRERHEGAYFLIVNLMIKAIRIVNAQYNVVTKEPSGASPVSGGRVQAQATPPPVTSALKSMVTGVTDLFK